MKKISIYTLICIMHLTAINAQKVSLGVEAGLNIYTINNNNNASYNSKAGFKLGLLAHTHLTKEWALQPEIVYSMQGAKYNTGNIETTVNLNYLNVPILLQYMFNNGFRLQAGPQLGILVNAKTEQGNLAIDIKNDLKKIDLALSVGAGYIHSKTGFGADVRYNLGLSNINNYGNTKSYNNGFQLGIFYLLKAL